MAIGSAIIAVGSTAMNYMNQSAQADAAEMQQKINNQLVVQGALDQYTQLDAAERDINSESIENLEKNQLSMLELQERAKLLAGASGTQGNSVNSIMQDIARTGGQNQAKIIANRSRDLDDITRQARSIYYGARQGADVRSLSKPSAAQAMQQGMQTYQGVSQLYNTWQDFKPATTTTTGA